MNLFIHTYFLKSECQINQEAIAVGRSFATIKGYHLDGNKEMLSMGVMNIAGSLSSCYVATGELALIFIKRSLLHIYLKPKIPVYPWWIVKSKMYTYRTVSLARVWW